MERKYAPKTLEVYFLHTTKPGFLASKPVSQFLGTLPEPAFNKVKETAPQKVYNNQPNTVFIEGPHLPDSKTLHKIELYYSNGLWNLRYLEPVLSKQELDASRIDTTAKNARKGDRLILISGQKEGQFATFERYAGNSIQVVLDDGSKFNPAPGSARILSKKTIARTNQETKQPIAPRKIVFESDDDQSPFASASEEDFVEEEAAEEKEIDEEKEVAEENALSSPTKLASTHLAKHKRLVYLLHLKKSVDEEIQTLVDTLYRDADNDRDLNVIPARVYVPPKPKVRK